MGRRIGDGTRWVLRGFFGGVGERWERWVGGQVLNVLNPELVRNPKQKTLKLLAMP
jgi:hypothetical protein